MATEKVVIPDFGDVQEITVVEIYVSVGDKVEVEDPLIALESEKAVMDIPSTAAGIVKEVYLSEDDNVSSGDAILVPTRSWLTRSSRPPARWWRAIWTTTSRWWCGRPGRAHNRT